MLGIDLNLLLTLDAFVEHGTVSGAARALGRSQPAISARLHQLEDDLGVGLFERSGRRLHLTAVGRAVHGDAQALLAGARALVDRARGASGAPSGLLRMGALPTVGQYVVAPLLPGWVEALPGAAFHLEYGLAHGQLAALSAGDLDVVLSVGEPPAARALQVAVLSRVSAVLAVPLDAAASLPDPVGLDESGLPYLSYGHVGDPFFDEVWRFAGEAGVTRGARLQVPHIQTLKALIAAGAGVSVLPDYTVVEPDIATRRVRGLHTSQPLWIATRRSAAAIPLVAWVARALQQQPRGDRQG